MKPEQQLSTESVFDGKILQVRVDTVALPDGRQASREVVSHGASVVIVPIDADDNVILVRQYRYPVGQTLLEAPAGRVEAAETPDEGAQRELREEIGYVSRNLRSLGGFWASPGFCTEYLYAYLAKDLAPSKLRPDDDEIIEVERVPLSQVARLIRVGEIQDAKTIASLLMTTCVFESD